MPETKVFFFNAHTPVQHVHLEFFKRSNIAASTILTICCNDFWSFKKVVTKEKQLKT
jgi:hypothetical protein